MDELLIIRDINRIDREIARARKALQDGVAQVRQSTAEVVAAKEALAEATAHQERVVKTEREASRRVRMLTTQRDRTQELIDTGRAPDYDRAMLQLSQQETLLDEAETHYLEAMEAHEAADAALAQATQRLKRARETDAANRTSYTERAPLLKAEIAQKDTLRPGLLEQIEPGRRRQYSDLQQRGLDALAHIVNGACNQCFLATPPQVISETFGARRIHSCRGCGRFFFAARPQSD